MRFAQRVGLALASVMLVAQAGCYKSTLIDSRVPGVVDWEDAPSESRWESFFLWGTIGHAEEDTREICHGAPPAMVRMESGFGTYLVTAVTLGIYSPRNLVVGCGPIPGAPPRVASSTPPGTGVAR